ncbi:MAG: hypothetical protein HQK51_14210 [Oligoflexia bacterium]|nr:hypothetical protein [Oligoflexia bacterium]
MNSDMNMNNMNSELRDNINAKNLQKKKIEVITLCALSDILIFIYVFGLYNNLQGIIKFSMDLHKNSLKDFSPEMITELMTKMQYLGKMVVIFTIVFFAVFHLINYWGFYNDKKWARSYVKILSWSGFILSSLFIISIISSLSFKMFYLLPLPVAYFLVTRKIK